MIRASAHNIHTLDDILQQKLSGIPPYVVLVIEDPHSAEHKDPWRTAPVSHRVTSAFNPRKSWSWDGQELWVELKESRVPGNYWQQGTDYRQHPAEDPGAHPRELDTGTRTDSNFMLRWITEETFLKINLHTTRSISSVELGLILWSVVSV